MRIYALLSRLTLIQIIDKWKQRPLQYEVWNQWQDNTILYVVCYQSHITRYIVLQVLNETVETQPFFKRIRYNHFLRAIADFHHDIVYQCIAYVPLPGALRAKKLFYLLVFLYRIFSHIV